MNCSQCELFDLLESYHLDLHNSLASNNFHSLAATPSAKKQRKHLHFLENMLIARNLFASR